MLEISNMIKMKSRDLFKDTFWKYLYFDENTKMYQQTFYKKEGFVYLPRNLSKFFFHFPDMQRHDPVYQFCEVEIANKLELSNLYTINPCLFDLLKDFYKHLEKKNYDLIIRLAHQGDRNYFLASYIQKIGQKTLIIADECHHEHMYSELVKFTDAKIQIVDTATVDVSDINIVTLENMLKHKHLRVLLHKSVGAVVFNDADYAEIVDISKVVQHFPAKYRLAFIKHTGLSSNHYEVLTDIFGRFTLKGQCLKCSP